jgi:hypothetical protein
MQQNSSSASVKNSCTNARATDFASASTTGRSYANDQLDLCMQQWQKQYKEPRLV